MRQIFDQAEGEFLNPAQSPRSPAASFNLPSQVGRLAERLGAQRSPDLAAFFTQSGQMWSRPGGRPLKFTAREMASSGRSNFMWRARMGPGGVLQVGDYLVEGSGGLELYLFGLVPLMRRVGGSDIDQGEALRYLAEIPWNPDAILSNPELDWSVLDENRLRVGLGRASGRPEVVFELDSDGMPIQVSATSRLYMDRGKARHLPWFGRFSHFQRIAGRLIPLEGEVAWDLEGEAFVYWRGRMTSWSTTTAPLRQQPLPWDTP